MSLLRIDEEDEDNQLIDETQIFLNLNFNQNLTESDIGIIDVNSLLENQNQKQERKDSGWRFDKINSMTLYFNKTTEMVGSNYVKYPMRS